MLHPHAHRAALLTSSVVVSLLLAASAPGLVAQVVINEVVASNDSGILDEDGDSSDWIELYNAGQTAVNLAGYTLSDDEGEPGKYALPPRTLPPEGFLLVFASGKTRASATGELHASFKVRSAGEPIILARSGGLIVDQVPPVSLSTDEAYARIPDGGADWRRVDAPTPGSANARSGIDFSHETGYYEEPFDLSIDASVGAAGGNYRYTLDGSLPTADSPELPRSLRIVDRSAEPNVLSDIPTTPSDDLLSYKGWEAPAAPVRKATVLRVARVAAGQRTGRTYTRTYFVGDGRPSRAGLPVIALAGNPDAFFHPDTGIYVTGVHFDPKEPEWTGNAFQRGEEWEREVHVTYFEPAGAVAFAQDAGVRLHGGKTRQAAQKSLKLYARSAYGKSTFDYPLLPGRPNVEEYKRILLRTTVGAWSGPNIVTDVLAQQVAASGLDVDYQEYQPALVYLNGEYWGLHTLRDRLDERYVGYVHDLDPDAVELFDWGGSDLQNLWHFAESADLRDDGEYARFAERLDVGAYLDYVIAEVFFANVDWPLNNFRAWRRRDGGEWRYILFDLDAGLGREDADVLGRILREGSPSESFATVLFRRLMERDETRALFVERFDELLQTTFRTEHMLDILHDIREQYRPAIAEHAARWNYPSSEAAWERSVDEDVVTFLHRRPCIMRQQLVEHFGLADDALAFTCTSAVDTTTDGSRAEVFPNPTHDYVTVRNASPEPVLIDGLRLHDVVGKAVLQRGAVSLSVGEHLRLDVRGLAAGVYALEFSADGRTERRMVVVR